MIPFDLHTHCSLSFDGESTAEEMAEQAVRLGMNVLALTDHVDLGEHPDPEFDLEATVSGAAELIPALQKEYKGKLRILYGVELGQPAQDPALAKKLLSENNYDFVIGSVHNIRDHEDFYFLDFTKPENEPESLLFAYFEEILETAELDCFDILGHLTYPLRYITGDHGFDVDMKMFDKVIDKILKTLIKNGKGIELNTSGLRQRIGSLLPHADIAARFYRLGGRIISIGSDAHKASDLGKGIEQGIAAAKEAGFSETAYFIGREPHFIKI